MAQRPSVSEDEVNKVLEKKLQTNKFRIVSYDLNMLGEWLGLCGDHALLKVQVKPGDESQSFDTNHVFFVKLYPRVDFVIEFIEGTGSFSKEIFTYKLFDLIENEQIEILNDCIAKCYLTEPKKFLIFENLLDQGFTTINKHELFDYDTIRVVLQTLAKFHASTLIYEEKKSLRLIDSFQKELQETYFNDDENFPNKQGLEAAKTGISNLVKLFNFPEKLLSGKDFQSVLKEECKKVFTLAKPSKKFRNVLCHGDIWATNLLIKHDDNNKPVISKLVDFQCSRYSPPSQDVLSVLHLTTSREFRMKHMYNLIGIYYSDLEKHITLAGYNMKKIIPFNEFLASCEEQKLFALIQTATYFPLILLKSEVVQDYFGNKEDNKEALLVDRSILVKEQMDKDELYKKRIYDCIQDLKDYCDYL